MTMGTKVNVSAIIGDLTIQLEAARADYKLLSDQYALAMGTWAICDGWFSVMREHVLAKERRSRLDLIGGGKE